MYRQQQQLYSQQQHDSYHVRQPDSTLFEDSPQNADSFEVYPNLRLQQLYQRNQGNPPNNYNQRLIQSEESGGGMVMNSEGAIQDDDDPDEVVDREGDSDIEFIIMNLYSKMKNLEGKYIDLANFYKQELVKTSTFKKPTTEEELKNQQPHYGQARVGSGNGITPSKSFERSVDMNLDSTPGKMSSNRGELPSEREIIRDLIEEKKKLEDDMKQMMTMKDSRHPHINFQQSPSMKDHVSDFQAQSISSDQVHQMKKQLQEALQDVIEKIDNTQKSELQVLTQKQNEMYTLATRYNLPSNIRNESLGLWYDAKTKISACMGEMKFQIQNKQKDLLTNNTQQKPKIRSKDNRMQEDQESHQISLTPKAISDLQREVAISRRRMEQQQKQIIHLKKGFNFQEVSLKEDQKKIQGLIKDIQESLLNFDRKDHLMLSGDKSQNLMSPFQKRIVSYQKSAEMRKQGEVLNRSGSRGRPQGAPITTSTGTNFYPIRDYQNPQILATQNSYPADNMENQDQESLRYIKSKLRNIEYTLEDMGSKTHIKLQEQSELDSVIESLIQDQSTLIKQVETQLNKGSNGQSSMDMDLSSNTRGTIREKSKPRGTYGDNNFGPISPNKQNDSSNNFYSGQRQSLQEKKISELQRNNDSLFMELRKANEKYLNQRVENNKLKDEVQILQNALQESNQQLKKQQQQIAEASPMNQIPTQKQSIKKKAVATSQRVDSHIPMSVTSQSMSGGGRQPSNSSILMVKENEDLKRKVQDLEKECFTLTYYQQEMQRRGGANNNSNSDPYLRGIMQDSQEMKAKVEQMCLKVQRFMFAMKRLQRAVNNKDKDIQIYKGEFEMNKKQLEQLVKETKEQIDNKQQNSYQTSQNSKQNNSSMVGQQPQPMSNHSMMATWDKKDQRFEGIGQEPGRGFHTGGQQRNRSQAPHAQVSTFNQIRNSRDHQPSNQYPISQRNEPDTPPQPFNMDNQTRSGGIRSKKPSHQDQQQHQHSNYEGSSLQNDQQQQQMRTSPSQKYQFQKVLEDVKIMQDESDKQKKQIEELKQLNEDLSADKNTLDVQLKSKSINNQKLSQQLKASSDTISRQEILINDYKEAIMQLEQSSNLSKKTISKAKTDLLMKERDLIHHQLNQDSNRQQRMMNGTQSQRDLHQELKLSQQIQQNQITQLREELMKQIQDKEEEMERHFDELNNIISEKDEDINRVKKLFVEKLRDIETSFVEISQEIVENDQLQQEASRKMQNQNNSASLHQSQFQNQKHDLEKSIDQVIGKYEDEQREEELNQLVEANEELLSHNSQLRQQIKELEQQVQQLTRSNDREEEFYTLKLQNEEFEEQLRDIKSQSLQKDKFIDEITNQKKQLDLKIKEFNKNLKSKDQNHQQDLNSYEEQIEELHALLKQEKEQRILFECEHNNKDKAYRQMKSQIKVFQTENDKLKDAEKDLKSQVENLLNEADYIKSIKQSTDGEQETEGASTSEAPQFNDEQENLKIESNPKETALSYLRMLKATNKEFAILQRSHEKLQNKFNEQKEKMDDLKTESREGFEQVMNMESSMFELQKVNENLTQEVNRLKGTTNVDEESIRQQVEEYFRDQIQFKDSEIESITTKLARLAQSNAEFQQKQLRLDSNNQELLSECEQNRNKIQSLEMEIEMTKSNYERDLDQLIEQEQQKLLIEKVKFESDKAKLQVQLNDQINTYEQEKQALGDKISKKKEKLSQLKSANQELSSKQKMGGLLQDSLKKGLEQKLIDLQREVKEEREAKEESEQQRQAILLQQEQEKEDMLKEQAKQKKELINKYQKELENEKNKLGHVAQSSSEREQELIEQHKQQFEELKEQLQMKKEELEYELFNKEKAKLQQLKKKAELEKQAMLQQKEQEQQKHLLEVQLENEQKQKRLQEEFEQEVQRLEQIKKEELNLIEGKLKDEMKDQETKQKRAMTLIQVLQNKARQVLIEEINNSKKELDDQKQDQKEQFERMIAEHEQQLKVKEKDKEQEVLNAKRELEIQEQHQNQLDELKQKLQMKKEEVEYELFNKQQAKLQQIKKKALLEKQDILQQKQEEEQKQKRSMSLILVLQNKARQILIDEINNSKKELDHQKDEFERVIQKNEHLLKVKEEEKQQEILAIQENLEQQKQKDLSLKDNEKTLALKLQEKVRNDLLQQIESQKQNHELEIESQKKELDRLKHQHDELVTSMSQQQDQQTQELLGQKEREIEELIRKSKEDHLKFEKDLKNKEATLKKEHDQHVHELTTKQLSLVESKDELLQQSQETIDKLTSQIKQAKEHQLKLESDIKGLKSEAQQLALHQEEQIEKFIKQKRSENEQMIQKHKVQMDQIYANCEKEIQEKDSIINELTTQIQQDKGMIDQLNIQVKNLQKEKAQQLKQKEEDLRLAKDEHSRLVEELSESNQNEIEQLQRKLEQDHAALLKKKDNEKSLFEKMQEKIRQELKDQLHEQEREKLAKQKVIESLEQEIIGKEKDMEKERVDQQELIDQLNISMRQVGQQKITLEKENEKMKKELDILKKQQQESEKELIRDLRDKLQTKEAQYDDIIKDKQHKEQEIASLKQAVKEKQTEISNLEKDLDQFVKESEEEKQQNENDFEQVNQKLKEIQKQKEQLEKDKKEVDLQTKMKEGLLKQLEGKIQECQEALQEKDAELDRLEETKNQSSKFLEKQVKDLQKKHKQEIQRLEEEKSDIKLQIQHLLGQNQQNQNISQSIEDIEQKLSMFEIELSKVKSQNKILEKQKELNDSLLDNIQQDKQEEIIGDVGILQTLQYCKRVKFLDKAWILVNKNQQYHWIDQDQIPIDRIQRIDVEQLEETQGRLKEKLEELIQEKDNIIKMMQVQDSNRSEKVRSDSQKAIVLSSENQDLKQQLQDLELQNNQLQQNNLQLKQKIKELNDMIFGLTDTDKNHDSVKKIYDFQLKNEELSGKLIKQYQISKGLEDEIEIKNQEIDKLSKRLLDADQSFLKNGNNNNSLAQGNFPLGVSSIVDDSFDGERNDLNGSKMQRLETEIEEFQKINIELEKLNKTLKNELNDLKKNQSSGSQQVNDHEIQEQLKHIRSILIKFLEKIPIISIENETLLPIVYSMMLFTKEEISQVQKGRSAATEQNNKGGAKKGWFGKGGSEKK